MQVSEVKLKRESERELFFAHYPLGGLVFAVIGMGFGYLPTYMGADSMTRWIFGGFGGLFAVIGVLGAFWRYELHLDLMLRKYTRLRGFWPSPKRTVGGLDELQGVVLTQEWSHSSSSQGGSTQHPWWKVSLEFSGWEKPVSIEAVRSEQKGYERLEYYAKKLKTWALDRTGDLEKKRTWDELDQTLADRRVDHPFSSSAAPVVDPSLPPPQSPIQVTGYPGNRTICLPPLGFNGGLVFLALFGLVFAAFGGFFLLAQSGLYTELTGKAITVKESTPGIGWIVSSVFICIGLGIMSLGLVGSYGREFIQEKSEAIIYGFRILGRSLRTKKVSKKAIEEIDLRDDISSRSSAGGSVRIGNIRIGTNRPSSQPRVSELFLRSDKQIIRLGKHLSESDKNWLLGAITQMVKS